MVPKYDLQIEALGALDELDSWLGYVVSVLSPKSAELAQQFKPYSETYMNYRLTSRSNGITISRLTKPKS